MEREEALQAIKAKMDYYESDKRLRAALETLIPELAESEDERIRKDIMEAVENWHPYERVEDIRAYLEKQKEPVVDKEGLYYYLGGEFIYCGYPATEENPYDFAISQQEKQKEQKPEERFEEAREKYQVEWSEDWREEDIQTRFAFYTYKEDSSVLYLSNVFVEEASRNHGFGTKILIAAEKVAETIGATTISLKVKQDSTANAWYRKRGYGYVAFEDGYDWLEKNLEYMKPNHNILPIEQQMEAAMIAIRGEMPFKSQGRSDEDEKIKKAISYAIAQSAHADNTLIDGITKDKALAYLDRQDGSKWSDEDEYALLQLTSIVQGYEKMQKNPGADCIMWSTDRQLPEKLFRFLKSLKPQAKQEWSEEEKMNIELLIALLRGKVNLIEILDSRKESIITFLKSLRPSWKPSKEQMEALEFAVKLYKDTHFEIYHEKIVSLYNQLKKLM